MHTNLEAMDGEQSQKHIAYCLMASDRVMPYSDFEPIIVLTVK